MLPFKTVIFDADGMLVVGDRFSDQLARDYGISRETTEGFFKNEFQDSLVGRADLKKVLPPYLKEWGWAGSVKEFLDYWFRSGSRADRVLTDYIHTLRQKGIKCYLATNQEKYRTEYFLQQMGFSSLFDGVLASFELGSKKPSRDFFKRVMGKLQDVDKAEILFWDDDALNVEGARKFGFQAEVYVGVKQFKEKMARYVGAMKS